MRGRETFNSGNSVEKAFTTLILKKYEKNGEKNTHCDIEYAGFFVLFADAVSGSKS